jgi:hypothetical protein
MVGWLSGVWAQTGSVAKWRYTTCERRLGEAAAPGGGECGPCPDFASDTLAFALQLRKITENLSQCNRKALGWSALNAIRLVDMWPAGRCRPWLSPQVTGSTLGQRRYLPNCRTRGFPTSANFESRLAVRALMWPANCRTARSSCICLLLTFQGAPGARRRHLDVYVHKHHLQRVLDMYPEIGEIVYLQTARWRTGWNHEVRLILFL